MVSAQIETVVTPIKIDPALLSGLSLERVNDPNQPDRELYQKRVFRGSKISVYIVSSETASAFHESYGIDEFLYLINGGARLKPKGEGDTYHYTGDFFMVPKGYAGDWETIGGNKLHHEVSVISTARNKNEVDPESIKPMAIDKQKLSGIGMTKVDGENEMYFDQIYEGHEITIATAAEAATTKKINRTLEEQVIYILAGSLTLTDLQGKKHHFFAGDFLIIPAKFRGEWKSDGHHLFRYIQVTKSDWKE